MSSEVLGRASEGNPKPMGGIPPANLEWLARGPREEALDPGLAIIDAHQHLFDLPGNSYLLDDFAADLAGGHRVVATVHNECMSMYRDHGPEHLRPVGETESIVGMVAKGADGSHGSTRVAEGIVGFADLLLGSEVREVLDAHLAAGGQRFKGIRFSTGWDDHPAIANHHTSRKPQLLADPAVRRGAAELQDLDLSLDVMVFFHQLDEVAALADALPDLNIVVGHCGGPLGTGPYAVNKDEHFRAWQRGIRNVATRPNVSCKLGGLLARGAPFDYLAAPTPPGSALLEELWRPWFRTCIDAFGPERSMFESNFPMEKLGVSYTVLWNTFKRVTEEDSPADREAMFAGTAARVYRLSRS